MSRRTARAARVGRRPAGSSDPFAKLLRSAVLWLDADRSTAAERKALNAGLGGSALDAQYGSSPSANTNDPLLLAHTGINYLYLPGVSGNHCTTSHSSAFNVAGDAEWVFSVAMDDWTPSGPVDVVMRGNVDPNRAWGIRLNTTGTIGLTWWPTGSAASSVGANSTVAVPFSDGQRGWVKVTLDVDNGASGRDVKFYTSTDGTTFTQLGSTVTQAGVTSLPSVTEGIAIFYGNFAGASPMSGKGYSFKFLDGIGGTPVFDADFTTGITSGGQTTFSATTGQTVTINRSTSGRKSVAVVRPVWLFGTDDYMEVADNDLVDFGATDSFTVMAVVRQWGTFGAGRYITKGGLTTNSSWGLTSDPTRSPLFIPKGTSGSSPFVGGPAMTIGALSVVAGVRDATADTLQTFTNGTGGTKETDPTTGTLANSTQILIGGQPFTLYADMELIAVAIFRRALTTDEIARIVTYYGAA